MNGAPSAGALRVTHIGGPTTLLEVGPWRLLTDPTFDPPGRRYGFGWGTSSRKVAGPAIAAGALGPIDAVLLSHDQHADNLDDAGRALLPASGRIVTTRAGARRLRATGATRDARGLAPWETTRLEKPGAPPIIITATPCRHGPPVGHLLAGDVIGFSLEWESQRHGSVWVSGDTVLYDGVREVARRLKVGTALLHLGDVRFGLTGPLRYTLTAAEAAELCLLIKPRTAIPVHFEGWSHFHEDRRAAERSFGAHPRAAELRSMLRWVEPGVAASITA